MRWFRRWKFFRRSPYIVRPIKITWTVEDANSLREFFKSDTGYKLIAMVDDTVYNAVMNGGSKDYVDGLTDVRQYLVELGSPDGALDDPRLKEIAELDEWRTE